MLRCWHAFHDAELCREKNDAKKLFSSPSRGHHSDQGVWYNGTEEECRRSWVDDIDVDDAVVDVNVDDANPL